VVLADEDMRLCGLWESCYPAQVDHGPMKKHHLVVFYRAIVHKPTTDLSLHLQEEVHTRAPSPLAHLSLTVRVRWCVCGGAFVCVCGGACAVRRRWTVRAG
jgi:hypothetical protein